MYLCKSKMFVWMRSLLNIFHYFLSAVIFHRPGGSPQRVHLKLCFHYNKDTLQGPHEASTVSLEDVCCCPCSAPHHALHILSMFLDRGHVHNPWQPMTISAVARKAWRYMDVILWDNGFWRNSFPEVEAGCKKGKVLGDCSGQVQEPRGGRARTGHHRNILP